MFQSICLQLCCCAINTSKPKQTICKAGQGIPLTSRLAELAKLWAVLLTVVLHRGEREKNTTKNEAG